MPSAKMLALLALCVASTLAAQDKEQLCTDIQKRPMRVGQWASYNWIGGRSEGNSMRMAVVGTETVNGTPYFWYEMSFTDPKKGDKGKTIMQMLVPGLTLQTGAVRGLIMKSGTDPAMRMPDQMVSMMGGQMANQNFAAEIGRRCREMDLVGWEQTTVPAGTFRALHIRSTAEQTEAWVLPDLYFALLKATMKDGSSMVLTGRGMDAKSSITETPQTMPSPR